MKKIYDIFLSYPGSKPRVYQHLRDALVDKGVAVGPNQPEGTGRWADEIRETIQKSRVFASLVSDDTLQTPHCRCEWLIAIDAGLEPIVILQSVSAQFRTTELQQAMAKIGLDLGDVVSWGKDWDSTEHYAVIQDMAGAKQRPPLRAFGSDPTDAEIVRLVEEWVEYIREAVDSAKAREREEASLDRGSIEAGAELQGIFSTWKKVALIVDDRGDSQWRLSWELFGVRPAPGWWQQYENLDRATPPLQALKARFDLSDTEAESALLILDRMIPAASGSHVGVDWEGEDLTKVAPDQRVIVETFRTAVKELEILAARPSSKLVIVRVTRHPPGLERSAKWEVWVRGPGAAIRKAIIAQKAPALLRRGPESPEYMGALGMLRQAVRSVTDRVVLLTGRDFGTKELFPPILPGGGGDETGVEHDRSHSDFGTTATHFLAAKIGFDLIVTAQRWGFHQYAIRAAWFEEQKSLARVDRARTQWVALYGREIDSPVPGKLDMQGASLHGIHTRDTDGDLLWTNFVLAGEPTEDVVRTVLLSHGSGKFEAMDRKYAREILHEVADMKRGLRVIVVGRNHEYAKGLERFLVREMGISMTVYRIEADEGDFLFDLNAELESDETRGRSVPGGRRDARGRR